MERGARHRVVVVGGGFGGLNATKAMKRLPVDITLVDRRNFHLFQPLLYQVATGGLSPGNIAAPLRAILAKQKNVECYLGEVTEFDLAGRKIIGKDGFLYYDTLIVATGSRTGYFGHEDWARVAPGLKSIEDALEIRRRVLTAFETAEKLPDPAERAPWMTFIVVGGGPTGVEMAGTLAEIARYTLRHDFRRINPKETHIILVDASEQILSAYANDLAESAREHLTGMGVEIRSNSRILNVDPTGAEVRTGTETTRLETRNIIWAAGVSASPLGVKLAKAAGVECDRAGRVPVQPDLTIAGHPEVFVIGDLANCTLPDGQSAPGLAPVAIQQGKYVARLIKARLNGDAPGPFQYHDLGTMATIGRRAAIVQSGKLKLKGVIAWYAWLFVHLMQIVSFQNRILVFLQWAWNYFTFARSARLITGSGYSEPSNPTAPPPSSPPPASAPIPPEPSISPTPGNTPLANVTAGAAG